MQNRIITLPAFTLMFPQLWAPRAIAPGAALKYTATAVFDSEADTSELTTCIKELGDTIFDSIVFRSPLQYMDKNYGFSDCERLNMSAKQRPLLREALPDQTMYMAGEKSFYSGCMCIAEIELFTYDAHNFKGVAAHMLSITKLADQKLTEDQMAALADPEPFNGL